MVHLFMDLQLTALVCFVLCDLLDGNYLSSALQRAHENFSEGADSALDFFRVLVLLL